MKNMINDFTTFGSRIFDCNNDTCKIYTPLCEFHIFLVGRDRLPLTKNRDRSIIKEFKAWLYEEIEMNSV